MISTEYRDVLRRTHAVNPTWGNGHPEQHLETVLNLVDDGDTILDYGCGKGRLVEALRALGRRADGYDPGYPQFETPPAQRYDWLFSFDVLEHVEPEHLKDVLIDMRCYAERALVTVSTVPAKKTLVDGRNAHLIVQPHEWWAAKLSTHWLYVVCVEASETEATFLCLPSLASE